MDEVLQKKDAIALRERAIDIRKWIPDDFFAGFCEVLSYKLQGRNTEYHQFLLDNHDGRMTDEARDRAYKSALDCFTVHDETALAAYVDNCYNDTERLNMKALLHEAINTLLDKQNQYANIPRDIFICHSSRDNSIAQQVYDRLSSDGNRCWIDIHNLPKHIDHYKDRITDSIKKCKLILVISSKACMLSDDPIWEMGIAQDFGLEKLEYKIDDFAHTSFFKHYFDGLQWINGYDGSSRSLEFLCERVYRLLHVSAPKNKPKRKGMKIILAICSLLLVLLI